YNLSSSTVKCLSMLASRLILTPRVILSRFWNLSDVFQIEKVLRSIPDPSQSLFRCTPVNIFNHFYIKWFCEW
ncbi:MAG TPA: hypothetical protein DF818_18695, partial [Bacteroidales bacterium]|nr:hypothetical protein [Bacteroidales bacterium]